MIEFLPTSDSVCRSGYRAPIPVVSCLFRAAFSPRLTFLSPRVAGQPPRIEPGIWMQWTYDAVTGSTCGAGTGSTAVPSRAVRALDLPRPIPCAPTRHCGCPCEISRHRRVRGMHLPDHAVGCQKSSRRGGRQLGEDRQLLRCHPSGGIAQVLGCVWAQRRRGVVRSRAPEMEFADQKVPVLSISIGYGIHRCGYLADGGGAVHTGQPRDSHLCEAERCG